jgi:hypothetical protein
MQMDKQLIRNMVIAPLMPLAVMFGYSQDAAANGPYDAVANQLRDGNPFRRVETVSAAECRRACAMEGECRSWVFVREWVETRRPICNLSSGIGRPHYDTCCISGIKPPPPAVKAGRDRPPPPVEGMARADPPPPVVKR